MPYPLSQAPGTKFVAITPHDTNPAPAGMRAIYVGSTGNLTVVDEIGVTTTFVGLLTGQVLPIKAAIVKSTGTTAGSLVAIA